MALADLARGLGVIALAGTMAIAQDAGSKPAGADKVCTCEDLVGRYRIVAGEREGVKEPEGRIEDTFVTFTKDKVVVVDKEKKERYSASYKLDSSRNPATIVMTSRVKDSEGEVARGLIKKDGETVHLIYALPTGEIPSGFKTREKQLMFVMKAQKDE
jgi:uncharacterized protein (TIGR03067 family)